MKNIKIRAILTVIFSLFLVSCVGKSNTGEGAKYDDNSSISAGKNTLGYYGENVKYGNDKLKGEWLFTEPSGNRLINARFLADGTMSLSGNDLQADNVQYGVGKNATILLISDVIKVTIQNELSDGCYKATYESFNPYKKIDIKICKINDSLVTEVS